jgi:hypothetical protein
MLRILLVGALFAGCNPAARVNYEKEKQDILELQARQRDYHFGKNAPAITALSSDSFLVVDGGTYFRPERAAQRKSFEAYFNSVEFVRWDDTKEPVVRFSTDASVAYVAVEKLVVLKEKLPTGLGKPNTMRFAWISIYKKGAKGWELDAIASTRKEPR